MGKKEGESMEDKLVMPCRWRYKGKCRHPNSQWCGNTVVGDKKVRCEKCKLYER